MTVAVVVHPYAGAGVEGLRYGPPVAIACAVRGRSVLADAAALAVCPLWSVLVLADGRRVRAVAVEQQDDHAVIHTEPMVRR